MHPLSNGFSIFMLRRSFLANFLEEPMSTGRFTLPSESNFAEVSRALAESGVRMLSVILMAPILMTMFYPWGSASTLLISLLVATTILWKSVCTRCRWSFCYRSVRLLKISRLMFR